MKCANEKCDKNPMSSGLIIKIRDGVYACDEVCHNAYNMQQFYYWEHRIFDTDGSKELPLNFNSKDADKP